MPPIFHTSLVGLLVMFAGESTAVATPVTVAGHVERVASRWAAGGDTIVTDIELRTTDGRLVPAVELGGVVGGIGIGYSHAPKIPAPGEQVVLVGRRAFDGPIAIQSITSNERADGVVAAYGIRRTSITKTPLRATGNLHVVYDAAGTSHIAGTSEYVVLDAAFAAWSDAAAGCGSLTFTSTVAPASSAADGASTVVFREDRWCRPATATEPELCHDPAAAATTRLLWIDDPSEADDGRILEADMEINAVDYALTTNGVSASANGTPADLGDVVTHEVGHVLGLTHNCWEGDGSRPADLDGTPVPDCAALEPGSEATLATMYFTMNAPGEIDKRTLEAGDREGACAVAETAYYEPQDITGGCSALRDNGWPMALVLAAWLGRRRRGARSTSRRRGPVEVPPHEIQRWIGGVRR